ncbi:NUDIX domain-containing protein [Nocardiopsis sp. NPDC049922]|uniref:NUDIX domain-containing protein n=1 Tax=Nocardiopsis sp. NPDC049922 TaxID=3155157 RepID=UPI0033F137EB
MPHTTSTGTAPVLSPLPVHRPLSGDQAAAVAPGTSQAQVFSCPRHQVSVTTVVLDADDFVLLVRDPDQGPEWTLPTGPVDQGEHIRSAAVRCVRERARVGTDPDRITGAYRSPHPAGLNLTWVAAPTTDQHPRHGAVWVPYVEALELLEADDRDAFGTGRLPLAQRLVDALAPFGTHMRVYRPHDLGLPTVPPPR